MTNTETALLNEANALLANPTVKAFVEIEAWEKVAADIREQFKGGTTAAGAKLLSYNSKHGAKVRERFKHYVAAGLVGCLLAKHSA